MPVYEYKCKECDTHVDCYDNETQQRCDGCGGALKRVFSCHIPTSRTTFQPHYNYSVGSYVSSWSEFSDKLKRRGEDNTRVTGIDHNYIPLHPADMTAGNMGATSEGLDNAKHDPNTTGKKVFI